MKRPAGFFLVLVLVLAVASGLIAGCGDDDDGGSISKEPRPAAQNESGQQPDGPAVLRELPASEPRRRGTRVDRIIGTENLSIEEYLVLVVGDVATFWQQQFAQAGYQYTTVSYSIVNGENEPVPAGCGAGSLLSDGSSPEVGEVVGPFYCFVNENVIYLPAGWLFDEAYGVGGREFAVAYTVAHEMGHHVQALLGTLDRKRRGEVKSIQVELQADCLAGVWARTLGQRGLLESNDLEEAISLAGQLGDVPGAPLESAHGSPEQRITWFGHGYDTGRGDACDTSAVS